MMKNKADIFFQRFSGFDEVDSYRILILGYQFWTCGYEPFLGRFTYFSSYMRYWGEGSGIQEHRYNNVWKVR